MDENERAPRSVMDAGMYGILNFSFLLLTSFYVIIIC